MLLQLKLRCHVYPKETGGFEALNKVLQNLETLLQILFLNFSGASYNLPKLFLINLQINSCIIITSSVNCLEALIMNI